MKKLCDYQFLYILFQLLHKKYSKIENFLSSGKQNRKKKKQPNDKRYGIQSK